MTQPEADDQWLHFLLAPADSPPDEQFVAQTMQLVAAEAAYRAAWRRLLSDWLWTMASLAGLLAGLAIFSQLSVFAALQREGILAIATPLVLVIALWLFASGSLAQPWAGPDRSRLVGAGQ